MWSSSMPGQPLRGPRRTARRVASVRCRRDSPPSRRCGPAGSPRAAESPRPHAHDVLDEQARGRRLVQPGDRPVPHATGARSPSPTTASVAETTTYRLSIPWFGWLFAAAHAPRAAPPPTRRRAEPVVGAARPAHRTPGAHAGAAGRRGHARPRSPTRCSPRPPTSPPTASASSTAARASAAPSSASACSSRCRSRSWPTAWVDGARSCSLAWLTPLFCALGALAPSFWLLVASQTVARPLGIALALLAARGRRRGDAAQQPRLRGQPAGHGRRSRCRRRGRARCASPTSATTGGGWSTCSRSSGCPSPSAWRGTSLETRRFETVHRIAPADRTGVGSR